MRRAAREAGVRFAAFAALLGGAAWLAPAPAYATDRDVYEAVGRALVVPDCSGLHCFRPLVPWIVDRFPGPSIVHWKVYAVLLNAAAGVATGWLARVWGLSRRGSSLAAAMSAFGFGAFFTVFDPHSADPLMFAAAPALFALLWRNQLEAATVLSAVAVMGKEFAAAPLWMFAAYRALAGRWVDALRPLASAYGVTLLWVALQLLLMAAFNYTYDRNASVDLLHGGYLRHWLEHLSLRLAVLAVYGVYGPVYVLAVVGLLIGGTPWRRLAMAAVPAALALCYVQQPDRALWNFHFVMIPLAALVLERAPAGFAWSFVGVFALANARLAAQLPFLPSSRLLALIALAAAVPSVVLALRRQDVAVGVAV
jgi:hypothetical protein